MEEEIEGKYFLERFLPDIYKLLIKRWIFDYSDEIEIRLPC